MSTPPSITHHDLVAQLLADGIINELDLIGLLGEKRHSVSLNRLELALVSHNVLSADRLADYKAQLASLPVYRPGDVTVTSNIPETIARAHGVLLTSHADRALVLMVEDTATNVEAVRAVANGVPFDIGLITAPHFSDMFRAAYSGQEVHAHPPAADLFDVLDVAIASRATDIHLSVGVPPRVRVDGSLRYLDFRPLDKAWLNDQVVKLTEHRHTEDLQRKFSTDLAYSFGTARFRVNIAHDVLGPTMALRQLPSKIPSPDDISLPEGVRAFAHLERGMVLVTGPTGSGKSTTLAAVLYEICMRSSRHVITLEDPIEFRLPTDGPSHVNQRELGSSFYSFPDGLRDALRQDPDVVLVGELRDADTIRTALTAAETGHLVLGTLHTYDAPSTIMRMVNSFPAAEQPAVRAQMSQMLKGIVSQTLIPKASGKGRVAGFELLLNNSAVATNLAKVDGHNSLKQTMQTSKSQGMQTMEMHLAELTHTGIITEQEARFRARDLPEFDRALKHLQLQGR